MASNRPPEVVRKPENSPEEAAPQPPVIEEPSKVRSSAAEEPAPSEEALPSGPSAAPAVDVEENDNCMLGGDAEPHAAEFVTTSKAVSDIKFCTAHRPVNYQTLSYERI